MSGRKLKRDELQLWQRVASSARPLDPGKVLAPPEQAPPPEPTLAPAPAPRRARDDLASVMVTQIGPQGVRMDNKAYKKLRRGKMRPDARLDLHGMTLDRAHGALNRFVLDAHGSGKRLLLVITGKGKSRPDDGPIPVRHGMLRHQVPEWLRLPPLTSVVLQVTQAHVSHGGGGAYYVYLRRSQDPRRIQ